MDELLSFSIALDNDFYINGPASSGCASWLIQKDMPLMSLRVHGKWYDRKVFSVRHGKQYVRAISEYELGMKEVLEPYQPRFARAFAAWRALSPVIKVSLDRRASKLGLHMCGVHYFMSLFLKRKTAIKKYYDGSLD
jgi:hypothetical protein